MLTTNVRSRKFPFFTFYAHPCRKPRSFDEKTAFFSYVLFIQNVVHFSFINHVHLRVREQTLRTTKFHSVFCKFHCMFIYVLRLVMFGLSISNTVPLILSRLRDYHAGAFRRSILIVNTILKILDIDNNTDNNIDRLNALL